MNFHYYLSEINLLNLNNLTARFYSVLGIFVETVFLQYSLIE